MQDKFNVDAILAKSSLISPHPLKLGFDKIPAEYQLISKEIEVNNGTLSLWLNGKAEIPREREFQLYRLLEQLQARKDEILSRRKLQRSRINK